jgi:two-component system CheB/CheR fusion protein
MMLGNEESTGAIPDLFRKVSSQLRIYQRSESLPLRDLVDFQITLTKKNTILNDSLSQVKTTENIQKLTDNLLLSQYAPSSVLVTNEGDILYITGHTGKYLEPASGKANMNIFNMIREDLQPEFPIGFKQALQSYDKVILQNLKIDSDGLTYFVDIIIQHLEKPVALKDMVLVIFKDVQTGTIKKLPKQKKGIVEKTGESENEIDRLREALKNTYEAVQISEEELKSANEELQSTNEELQSTNEELVSSKEEMQSMNEELQTVNTELMTKIDEFTRTNNDLKNLLESTEIATLFLDRELNIRRFTNPVTEVFRLLLADIGRPIKDFSTNLLYPEIFDDSKKVLRTLSFIEKEITTKSDKWFKVRIMPYRTIDDMIDGLVITFSDISKAKKLEIELNEKIMKLKSEYNPNS